MAAGSARTHSILRIPVRAGAEDEFERTFKELHVFDHASRIRGFRSGRIFRPLTPGEPFVVMAEWNAPDAYEAWLRAPVRDELSGALEPLLASEMAGGVYSVVEESRGLQPQ